ncbi:isocitrate/isopropylmalate dehydrogenase family protein [Telmatospirillum sp. J64-1]|uniref:isocitrate/isopropylmalate dehydrogenase family protein n=1 Tax=Telmatospirillum sp. J64-1 TaxID=2502183 RepID=UPI00115D81B3|nr:isocitrate/isopropylmalate family dehydrogenase [Telmatospirillum sp. J64-1]
MNVLILPGDGIGPELAASARATLEALNSRFALGLVLREMDIGYASLEKSGSTIPDDVVEEAGKTDLVVLGPVDTANYPPPAEGGINPSARLRKGLDLFANIRPSRSFAGVPALAPGMDLVIVRENTEGFYADRTMFAGNGEFMPTPDLALAVRKVTREGSRRVADAAAALAAKRRKRLTIVHKANVLKLSDGMFLEEALAAAARYPGLEVDEMHVDAAASWLVRAPERFDVIVTTNMFGDILSNQAAELSGGLGMAASLNAGFDTAVAQAAHGSAPDIAGQDRANPISLLLSTAMLLEWRGERAGRNDLVQAGKALTEAVAKLVAQAETRTYDLGGTLGTKAFTAALCQLLADA